MEDNALSLAILGLGIMACMVVIAIAGIITKQTPFALNTRISVQGGAQQQVAQAGGSDALPPPAEDVPLAVAGAGHCGGGSGGGCGCGAAK